jgi:hypothetical protein
MREGMCKLCLQMKDIQDSHFIPRAMYKHLREPLQKNSNPVVVGRRMTATTSKQLKDYLLCAECEDLFNKNGENEVLKWVWNGKSFPLGDRLRLALPSHPSPGAPAFSGTAVGVDTERLAYFALSVLWRAAVHQWEMPFGGKTTVLDLGAVEEPIRKFLLGIADFPAQAVIVATACIDPFSAQTFYIPSRVIGVPETRFAMLTLGVHFTAFIGSDIPPSMREICCAKSTERLIFQRNCSEKTLEAFSQIMKTNKRAGGKFTYA